MLISRGTAARPPGVFPTQSLVFVLLAGISWWPLPASARRRSASCGCYRFIIGTLCELVQSSIYPPSFQELQRVVSATRYKLCDQAFQGEPKTLAFQIARFSRENQENDADRKVLSNILEQMVFWFETFGRPVMVKGSAHTLLFDLMENALCRITRLSSVPTMSQISLSEPEVAFFYNIYNMPQKHHCHRATDCRGKAPKLTREPAPESS